MVDDQITSSLAAYLDGRLDRRAFLQKMAAIGVGATSAASLLAACGGSGSSASSTTAAQIVKGGILHEGYNRDVSRPDPVNTFWADPSVWPVLHETVITQDPQGKFTGSLASQWATSSDGLEWTFTIRPGLKFQSGAPCDASAIAEAMNEFRNPSMGTNAGFWAPVVAITADGPTTVKVKLKHPYADLPWVLNNGYSAIFNPAVRKKLGVHYGETGADGTGPFKFESFVPGSHMSVKKWAEYPGGPPFLHKGPAYLDGITWEVMIDATSRVQGIQSGTIDTLIGPAPQDVAALKGDSSLSVIEFQNPAIYVLGLNFKETDLGFDDPRVRRAISYAIDRETIAKTVFFGQAVPAYTLANSQWAFYDKSVEQYTKFDPAQAKQLLSEAGWKPNSSGIVEKNGKPLSFSIIAEENDKLELLMDQAIQQMLKAVGIQMNFVGYGANYFDKFLASPQGYTFQISWSQILDASLLFSDVKYVSPACCNASFANVAELNDAYDEWQHAGSETAMRDAASKAQLVAAQQAPLVPLVTPVAAWAHTSKVHNWLPNPYNFYSFYNDVWLDA
jgi:peptide/nickel transport system substrate-binding protein